MENERDKWPRNQTTRLELTYDCGIFLYLANEVDGEDFFEMELRDINQMIPRFKIRKRFLAAWTEITNEVQRLLYFHG